MEKINKVWFYSNRIFIETDSERIFSRALEVFPALMEASEQQRLDFVIGRFRDDIRWPSIDEDIHISSFLNDNREPDYDNEIAKIFARFPQLNVSEIARTIGINKSLLSKYIYGIKKPSEARKNKIIAALHKLGRDLMSIA